MKRSSSCRLRKVACDDCGYTARITRSWLNVGLPGCPCGGQLRPTSPADLAWCGIVGPDDMPAPQWTAICRENGWDDAIQRKGAAAKAYERRLDESGRLLGRSAGKPQCSYPGCGRWTASGAKHCQAHDHELAVMPF